MVMKKLYAFWKYDLFPFMLGDSVDEVVEKGHVKVDNYSGSTFKPFAFLNYNNGRDLNFLLKQLEYDYKVAQQNLLMDFVGQRNELLKNYGIDPPKEI